MRVTTSEHPRRGELYMADLNPVVGHEQGGRRPFLVLSIREMNRAPLGMAIGLPITTTHGDSQLHIRIESENGLPRVSYAMPEMVRAVSTQRFSRRLGRVPRETLETAVAHTGFLLGLGTIRF